MRERSEQLVPLARRDELVVRELPDEVLIYDLTRHKAHCLNQASALVWKHCDGKMTVAELKRLLEREFATPVDMDVVWLALNQLRRFHLLEEGGRTFGMMKVSRRDLVRKYLPAALVLPLILSIPAPTVAQTGSTPCGAEDAPCGNPGDLPCCPGLDCGDGFCFPIPPP
ncbi:MAG TPA: PqqD family protein [Pyrinomonadaceae bacterium]